MIVDQSVAPLAELPVLKSFKSCQQTHTQLPITVRGPSLLGTPLPIGHTMDMYFVEATCKLTDEIILL